MSRDGMPFLVCPWVAEMSRNRQQGQICKTYVCITSTNVGKIGKKILDLVIFYYYGDFITILVK